jgi:hypothetical protein
MTTEAQEAQVRLGQLQAAIAKFNKERLKTEAFSRGLKPCRVPPDRVAAAIEALRDRRAEEEAARQLADLQRLMLGRDPTPSEAASGVAAGMSGAWLVPGVVAGVAAGAWVLTSIFNYLASHEQRIQRELNPGAVTTTDIMGWVMPAAVVGGLLVGGYYLLRDPLGGLLGGKSKAPPKRRLPRTELAPVDVDDDATTWRMNAEDEPDEPDEPETDDDDNEDDEEGEA